MLDTAFMTKVIKNLTLFYKAYVVPCMLGYRNLLQCPKCEKVILDLAELNVTATERSICCDTYKTWWHLPCVGLTEVCAETHGFASVASLTMLVPLTMTIVILVMAVLTMKNLPYVTL